jgi:hypothetical protein
MKNVDMMKYNYVKFYQIKKVFIITKSQLPTNFQGFF